MSYLRYLCLIAHSGVQSILHCVFVLSFFVLCTPCCQFLWIVEFWLPLRYSLTFIEYIVSNLMKITSINCSLLLTFHSMWRRWAMDFNQLHSLQPTINWSSIVCWFYLIHYIIVMNEFKLVLQKDKKWLTFLSTSNKTLLCSQNFKLFGFPIFQLWAYLMKVIPKTFHVQ